MTQCDYTFLLRSGVVQCDQDGIEEVDGSIFCTEHAPIARQSALDDITGQVERDMATWDEKL